MTLKSSSDSERPLCVVSGFAIPNFNLGCKLFIVWCIGLPFLHKLSGDKCRQRISYRGLSIGVRRGLWFLVCPWIGWPECLKC